MKKVGSKGGDGVLVVFHCVCQVMGGKRRSAFIVLFKWSNRIRWGATIMSDWFLHVLQGKITSR